MLQFRQNPSLFARFFGRKTPVARVAVPVGQLAAVLRDGDRLMISRGASGDTAVLLARDEERLAGFGSVVGAFTTGIRSDDDPRVHDARHYGVKHSLADDRTTVVWVDASEVDLERIIARIRHVVPAGGRAVVAVAGGTGSERARLVNQIGESTRRDFSSTWFPDVPAEISTEADWRAFIDGLPAGRPDDLRVRFSVEGTTAMLREREYRELPPWQLYVHDVSCSGVPGRPSHVRIVHASLGMSRQAVIDTSDRVASGVTFLR